MMWLRAGQDGRSWAPINRTAPPWKQELRKTTTSERNDKNYYGVLEECYANSEIAGKPELVDTTIRAMTKMQQIPGVDTAMKNPARPGTTTQTTRATREGERFTSWQR